MYRKATLTADHTSFLEFVNETSIRHRMNVYSSDSAKGSCRRSRVAVLMPRLGKEVVAQTTPSTLNLETSRDHPLCRFTMLSTQQDEPLCIVGDENLRRDTRSS